MNNNDNLKEKEIKKEAPLKQNELGNVSGGSSGIRLGWYMPTYCIKNGSSQCDLKYPCMSACCNSAIVREKRNDGVVGYYAPAINYTICTDCWDCVACAACPAHDQWLHGPVW